MSEVSKFYEIVKSIFSSGTKEDLYRIEKMEERYNNLKSINMNDLINKKITKNESNLTKLP